MAEIYNQKGVVIIITFLALGILLFLGTYFLSFTLSESRIAESQGAASQTYYLAEAGINEAIWQLKNDHIWSTCFISNSSQYGCSDCDVWQASFTKNYTQDSTTTVSIQNSRCARGEIIATSTIALPKGKTAQRVIKTTAYKAIGDPIEDSGLFSGGTSENIIIDNSWVRIDRGNIFSNNNLIVRYDSLLEVFDNSDTIDILEGQVLAVRNLEIKNSTVTSASQCAKNVCTPDCQKCPPDRIEMPAVDFDSDENPNSLKNRAKAAQDNLECQVLCNGASCSSKCIFTESEFKDLLWQIGLDGILTLNNAITYVEGEVKLRGGRELIVNGILAADRYIKIGGDEKWKDDEGQSHITVNELPAGRASGLLSKSKIYLQEHAGFLNQVISITGVVYSIDETKIDELPEKLEITGGILANALSIDDLAQELQIIVDNEKISRVLYLTQPPEGGAPIIYSPIVTIKHWEEVY